jgi:hypothetical protein
VYAFDMSGESPGKLFTPRQIVLATLLGSPIAGLFSSATTLSRKSQLMVELNGKAVVSIERGEQPVERRASIKVDGPIVELTAREPSTSRRYVVRLAELPEVGDEAPYVYLSVRILENHAGMIDCVLKRTPEEPAGPGSWDAGVRFLPWFLTGAAQVPDLKGKGLFARGLHFAGTVTPGNIVSACVCDACAAPFILRHLHAGFSKTQYFYCERGQRRLRSRSLTRHRPANPWTDRF